MLLLPACCVLLLLHTSCCLRAAACVLLLAPYSLPPAFYFLAPSLLSFPFSPPSASISYPFGLILSPSSFFPILLFLPCLYSSRPPLAQAFQPTAPRFGDRSYARFVLLYNPNLLFYGGEHCPSLERLSAGDIVPPIAYCKTASVIPRTCQISPLALHHSGVLPRSFGSISSRPWRAITAGANKPLSRVMSLSSIKSITATTSYWH